MALTALKRIAMKKIFLLSLFVSNVSFATCIMIDEGPAQCNFGSGNGQNQRTIQPGPDSCPGNRLAVCPKKTGVALKIDHIRNEDRCILTKCHAPGGGPGPAPVQ
jgi:hypothetical protein